MGLISGMVYLQHIDRVIAGVRSNPPYPNDSLLEIHGRHEAKVVALDVEDDPLCAHDAGGRIAPLDIRPLRMDGLDGRQHGLARPSSKRDRREERRGKQIVLARLVDNPELTVFLGGGIRDRRVDLPRFERYLVALVAEAEDEPRPSRGTP